MTRLPAITPFCLFLAAVYWPAAQAEPAQLDCLIKPEMYVELSSQDNAIIEALLVKTGDHVKKGQPLVQLEASVEKSKVALARLQSRSDIDIRNRQIQLKYAKRTKDRLKSLIKSSIALSEKDRADTELELAQIELKKAIEQRELAKLNLKLAEAHLAQKTIRSPIDGIVVDRYRMVGESVADLPIMKLAKIDPLRIELIAPTEYFGLIERDIVVDITAERPVDRILKATVTHVDQLIDPASGSFTVHMTLPNPDEKLVAGVNCVAHFRFERQLPSHLN